MTKYTYEEVCNRLSEKGHKLLSSEFNSVKFPLSIECKCGMIYEKSFERFSKGHHHCNGKIQRSKKEDVKDRSCLFCGIVFRPRINRTKFCSLSCSSKGTSKIVKETKKKNNTKQSKEYKKCMICQKDFIPRGEKNFLCSRECVNVLQRTDDYKEKAKIYGSKGGKVSVTSQKRRSKNEVYFAELCEGWFGKENVKTNEPMFDGWDADVILPHLKRAVSWDGVWHHKQISKSQSLLQVQTRDKIKLDVIRRHGYTPYIIADLGKFNPAFVTTEFECFLYSLIDC